MSALYLETSALLRWLLGEAGTEDCRRQIDAADPVLISELTLAESGRALVRAEQNGALTGGDAQRLRGLLSRVQATWIRMGVTGTVLERAARSFPAEPVRTLDAIHLATALEFAAVFPDIRVLTYDQRVRSNAEALGL